MSQVTCKVAAGEPVVQLTMGVKEAQALRHVLSTRSTSQDMVDGISDTYPIFSVLVDALAKVGAE